MSRLLRVLAALCALLILSLGLTATAVEDSKETVAATAAWFDSLGWPDVRDKPYVEVTFGKGYIGAKQVDGPMLRGFLLAQDDHSITVWSDGTIFRSQPFQNAGWPLIAQQYQTDDSDFGEVSKIRYRTIDLAEAVAEVLTWLRAPKEQGEERRSQFGRRISDRTAVFVLARCCARQGRPDLAAQLDEMTLTARFHSRGNPGPQTFRDGIEKEIAHLLMWKAVKDCGDASVSRPQLLTQFERIVRDFPSTEHRERAAGFAEMLRTMIAEDEAHARTLRPLAEMTQDEKVHELIFRLRDQNGHQLSQPGSCDVFATMGGPNDDATPAHQLVKLGYAAVPALIEALSDTRLSRSVGFSRDFFFSHFVLTVGDCSAAILGRISGRQFWVKRTTSAAMQKDGQLKATQDAVREWWEEVQKKGEKQILIEGIRRGVNDSAQQVARLAELDPSAAVEAISRGIRAAKGHSVRTQLVEELTRIKGDVATRALEIEMKENASLNGRVAAATELFRRGNEETVPAMIAEWQTWAPARKKKKQIDEDEDEEWRQAESLIEFLGACGHAPAIQALADRFPTLPIGLKFNVLEAATGTGFEFEQKTLRQEPRPAEADVLGEKLAIAALDDRQAYYGMMGNRGHSSYRDPRVCDMAADALARRWPERYRFEWSPTRLERDPQIATVRNTWRSARGLPPQAAPPARYKTSETTRPDTLLSLQWSGGPAIPGLPIAEGQPITADALIETLVLLHRQMPEGRIGFDFVLERATKGPGFVLDITWRTAPGTNPGSVWMAGGGWSHATGITLGGESLYSANGGGSFENRSGSTGFEEEKRALIKALVGDSQQAIAVTLSTRAMKE